jgi:cardiolipin synthase
VLQAIFEEDWGFSVPFECGLDNYTVSGWGRGGVYMLAFGREHFSGQDVKLIASPGSLNGLLSLIASANSSISVEQYYAYQHWGSVKYDTVETAPSPLLEALIGEARRGIDVRVLLDSTYFNMDEEKGVSNLHTIDYLNSIGEAGGIPLSAKAIDLDRSGLEKAHNKGLVIDGKLVLVSSINWNENSVMNNREVGLVISGEAAGYYARAFEHDWSGSGFGYGLGVVPAFASLALLIMVVAYFGGRRGPGEGRFRSGLSLFRQSFLIERRQISINDRVVRPAL